MRIALAILLIIILPITMKSQTATATIGSVTSCPGGNVLAPVDVTGFVDIGAMTIYVDYDTNAVLFTGLQNINPVIPGGINVNATNGQVGIAYSNITPFTLNSGKLFDLSFDYLNDSSLLTFNEGTEIANINLEIIPLDTTNGGIFNSISITAQPDSVQAYPDQDVAFIVTASGGSIDYQWQEDNGSGWSNLQTSPTYSGVNNDTLIIYDVSLSFNGNLYRCVLTSGNCEQISDVALLEVALAYPAATLGQVSSCPREVVFEPLYVGDFFDVVNFTFNIGYDTSVLTFISLENIIPELQAGALTTLPLVNPAGISVQWSSQDPISITSGKLFDLKFDFEGMNTVVAFVSGTQVLNSLNNPINITLTNGHVHQHVLPVISQQPEDQSATTGDEVTFTVVAEGAESFQWQVSTDGGLDWNNIDNIPPYYGVTEPLLTISPVGLIMNGYFYSCLVSNEFCTIRSDAAQLSVDTLEAIIENGRQQDVLIYPNPAGNFLTVSLDNPSISEIKILNLAGQEIYSSQIEQGIQDQHVKKLNLSGIAPGVYILTLQYNHNQNLIIERKKFIKSN